MDQNLSQTESSKTAVATDIFKSEFHHEKLRELQDEREARLKIHLIESYDISKTVDDYIQSLQECVQKIEDDHTYDNANLTSSVPEAEKVKILEVVDAMQASNHNLKKKLDSMSLAEKQSTERFEGIYEMQRTEITQVKKDCELKISEMAEQLQAREKNISRQQTHLDSRKQQIPRYKMADSISKRSPTLSSNMSQSDTNLNINLDNSSLGGSLEEMHYRIKNLEENNTSLVGDKENLLKRIKELERKYRPLQDKNKRFLEKNMELTTINRSLEEKIQKLTEENKKVKNQVEHAKRKAHQVKQQQSVEKVQLQTLESLSEEIDDYKRQTEEQNKTISALRQACVEKDRRLEILQHRKRKQRTNKAQQRAAGIKETSFGFEDDNRSIDSDISTCSLSYDAHTDDETWDEFAREEFERNYHRLAKEHVELEKSYALLQAQLKLSLDPQREFKLRTQLESDLILSKSKIEDLEGLLSTQGQNISTRNFAVQVKITDTSWVEDKSKLNAANRVLINKIAALEDAELKLRHELMEAQEQNEVLEFRCLELEEVNEKLIEELKTSSPLKEPAVLTNHGVLQLYLLESGLYEIKLEELKDKLHYLKYNQEHHLSMDEKNTLVQAKTIIDAVEKKLKQMEMAHCSLKERIKCLESEKADLLSAATGISSDIVFEYEEARNKLMQAEIKITELETEITELKKTEAVYKYTDEFNQKSEERYKKDVADLKRKLNVTLEGQTYESDFVKEKMDELKQAAKNASDLENTICQLEHKVDDLQRENADLSEQLSNHQEEQSLAESDRHMNTLVQSLRAHISEQQKAENELMEKNSLLENKISKLNLKINDFEESELELVEKNYLLEEEVEKLNDNAVSQRTENEKLLQQLSERNEKFREQISGCEKNEQEILDKNKTLEDACKALREKLKLKESELEHLKSLEQDCCDKDNKILTLEQEFGELRIENIDRKKQLEELLQLQEKLLSENNEEKSDGEEQSSISDLELERNSLKKQIDHLQVSEMTLKERIQDLETSENLLKENLESMLKKSKETEFEYQKKINAFQQQEHELKEQLEDKVMIEQALEEKVKNMELTESKAQQKMTSLEEKETKLTDKLQHYKSLEKDLCEVENLKQLLAALENTNDQLRQRIDEMEDDRKNFVLELETKVDTLKEKLKKSDDSNEILNAQVECLEDKVRMLESLNTELTEEHPEETVGGLKRQISDIGHEADKLNTTIDEKTMKIELLQEEVAVLRENEQKLSETVHELEHVEQELRHELSQYQNEGSVINQLKECQQKIREMEVAEIQMIEKLEQFENSEKEFKIQLDTMENENLKLQQVVKSVSPNDFVISELENQVKSLEKNEEKIISRIYELEQSEKELSERLSVSEGEEHESYSSPRLQELELSCLSLNEKVREVDNSEKELQEDYDILEQTTREQISKLEKEKDSLKQELEEQNKEMNSQIQHLKDKENILIESENKLMEKISELEYSECQLRTELESTEKIQEISLQDEIEQVDLTEVQTENERVKRETESLKPLKEKSVESMKLDNESKTAAEFSKLQEKVNILLDSEQKLMDRIEEQENIEAELIKQIELLEKKDKESEKTFHELKTNYEELVQKFQKAENTFEKSENELMEKCVTLETSQAKLLQKVTQKGNLERELLENLSTLEDSMICTTSDQETIPSIKVSDEDGNIMDSDISGEAGKEILHRILIFIVEVQDSRRKILELKHQLKEFEDQISETVSDLEQKLQIEKEQYESKVKELQTIILAKENEIQDKQAILDIAQTHETITVENLVQKLKSQKRDFDNNVLELQQKLNYEEGLKHEENVETSTMPELSSSITDDLEAQLSEKENIISDLQTQLAELHEKIQSLEHELDSKQDLSVNSSISEMEAEKLEMAQKIYTLDKDVVDYKRKISGLKAQVDNFESELAERNSFAQNSARTKELSQKIQELEMREQDYKARIEDLENQVETFKNQIQQSEKQLAEYKTRSEELESQFEELNAELESEDVTTELRVSDLKSSPHQQNINEILPNSTLKAHIAELQIALASKTSELESLRLKISDDSPEGYKHDSAVANDTNDSVRKSVSFKDLAPLSRDELIVKVRELENAELIYKKHVAELDNHLICFRESVEMLVEFMEAEGHDMADFRQASIAFNQGTEYDRQLRNIVKSEANLSEKVKHLERKDLASRSTLRLTEREYQQYIEDLEDRIRDLEKSEARLKGKHGGNHADDSNDSSVYELQHKIFDLEASEKCLKSKIKALQQTEQDLHNRLKEAINSGEIVEDFSTQKLRKLEEAHREKVEELLTRIQELEDTEETLQEKLNELKKYNYEELIDKIDGLERSERALQRKIEILETQDSTFATDTMLDRPEDILRQRIREMERMEKHLRHQISDLEHDREELHEIARRDKSLIHELNVRIRELTLSEKILKEQVNRYELTEESLYYQVDNLQERVQELEDRLNNVTASERSLQGQLKEYRYNDDSNKRRTADMEADLEELRTSELNLKKRQNDLEKEREALKKRIDVMHDRIAELDQTEMKLKQNIRSLENNELSLKGQLVKVESSETTALQRISDLERVNEKFNSKIYYLNDENSRLKNDLSDSEIRNTDLGKQIIRLQDEEKSLKKQIHQLENSEFELQKKIQELQFGQHDMLNKSQETERSELRLQDKIVALERNEHKLKLRLQELEASVFMAENKALGQTELEDENRLLHSQLGETQRKVNYFEHRSKGLEDRLNRYETCNRDDMAVLPKLELAELRAQVELLKEHEENIQRLERSEINLKDTIKKLRQGKNACGHEQELQHLKNQVTKHNLVLQEKMALQVNYEHLKQQFQQLHRQLESGDGKPLLKKLNQERQSPNEEFLSQTATVISSSGRRSDHQRTPSYNHAINEFVNLLPTNSSVDENFTASHKTSTNMAPPNVHEEKIVESRVSSKSLKNNSHIAPKTTSDLNLGSDEEPLWQTVEDHKPDTEVKFNDSLWDNIEKHSPKEDNVQKSHAQKQRTSVRFASDVVDNDSTDSEIEGALGASPPLPKTRPPPLPNTLPPPSCKHDGDSSIDDSYYLPSTHQGTDGNYSADEAPELQVDIIDSPPPLPKSPMPNKSALSPKISTASISLKPSPEHIGPKKTRSIGSKITVPTWLREESVEAADEETAKITDNLGISFAAEVQTGPPIRGTPTIGSKIPTPSWLSQDDGDAYIYSKAAETERGYKQKISDLEKQMKSLETQLKLVRLGNKANWNISTASDSNPASNEDSFTLKAKIKDKERQLEVKDKAVKDLRLEISKLENSMKGKERTIQTQQTELDRLDKIISAKQTLGEVGIHKHWQDRLQQDTIQLEKRRHEMNAQEMTTEHWKSMCDRKERELIAKTNEVDRMSQELRRWQDEARNAEAKRIENVANTGHMEVENKRLKDINQKYQQLCDDYSKLKQEHEELVEKHKLCTNLEQQRDHLQELVDKMKIKVEKFKKLESDRELLENEVKNLLSDVERKTKSEETLFRENLQMKRNSEEMTEELSRLERVEKDFQLIKSRYDEMERVKTKAQTSVSPLRTRVISMAQKCKQKDDLMRQLIEQNKQINGDKQSDAIIAAERMLSKSTAEDYNRPLSPLTSVNPETMDGESPNRSWLKKLKTRFHKHKYHDNASDISTSSYRSLEELDYDESQPSYVASSSRLRTSQSESGLQRRRDRSRDNFPRSDIHSTSVPHLHNDLQNGEQSRNRRKMQNNQQRHLEERLQNSCDETDTFRVISDYNPEHFSRSGHQRLELPLHEGDIVTVFGPIDDKGYYEAEANGRTGLVPSSYLQPVRTNIHSVESVAQRRHRHMKSLEHVNGMPEQILHMQSILQEHPSSNRQVSRYRPGEHDRVGANLGEMLQSLALGQHSTQLYNGGSDQAFGLVSPEGYQSQAMAFPQNLNGHYRLADHTPSHMSQPQMFSTPNNGGQLASRQRRTNDSGQNRDEIDTGNQLIEGPPNASKHFHVEKVLADHSVLLSWDLPEMDEFSRSNGSTVSGYKIFINGKEKHHVKSAHLRKVLLEKLDLHRPQHFSIQTVATNGHLSSMTDVLFDELLPEPSGDSGTVTESSDIEHDTASVISSNVYSKGEKRLHIGIYDYNPMEHSPNAYPAFELPFRAGDLIKTYGPLRTDGFYHGEIHGRRGLVPASFMEEIAVSQRSRGSRHPRNSGKTHSVTSSNSQQPASSRDSSVQSGRRKGSRHSKSRHQSENINHRAKEVRL